MGRMRKINRWLITLSYFICIFFTSFSKDEVTTIEALPRRERANLDIEVLKIKTDKITGIIYENEKKIIFDFKELKKEAEKKKIITDSSSYEIFILENLDNAETYMKNNEKFKMNAVFERALKLRNGEKIKLKNISYGLIDQDREKVLEVLYDLKPETFYLGILNNKTGLVEKIYKTEFSNQSIQLNNGSLSDFSYSLNNRGDIIIEPNHIGDYISNPMTIRFEQKYNNDSELFPIIGLGDETVWKKENHNGGLPVEGTMDSIEVGFSNTSITGKMYPQLKYKNSNPSGNIGQTKKVYYHNILGESSNKIAIGAYETSENEFVEAELTIKIDASTIEEMKSYVSKATANSSGLVEIPYKSLTSSNQISLVLGSSEGNGYYDIPSKNLSSSKINLSYPKIYMRKTSDNYEKHFSYSIAGLKDHIIEESAIESISGNYYLISLGTVYVKQELGATDKDRVPTIGLGTKSDWEYKNKVNKNTNTTVQGIDEISDIYLNLNEKIKIYPYLIPKTWSDKLFRKTMKDIGVDSNKRSITLASYGGVETITAEVKIAIPKAELEKIKSYADSKSEDIVDIPYSNDYKISLIPSSATITSSARDKILTIPDTSQGEVREVLYPKIKFKKKTGNENTIDNFIYDYKLNNLEIGESELIENNDLERETGFVSFQQKSLSSKDTMIPMIALGQKENAPRGYQFNSNSTVIDRDSYVANYSTNLRTYPYFKDPTGGILEGSNPVYGGMQKSNDNSNLGVWVYSNAGKEEVSAKLALKIKNEDKKDFLKYAREIKSERVKIITDEKVAFVQGSYTSNKYKFPMDNNSSRITEVNYPNITVVKDIIINNNIEIEFKNSYKKGERVNFDFIGNSINSNVEVKLNSGQFMNGLELNDGILEISSGDNKLISININTSGETIATIQESKLKMDVIYNSNGLASIILHEWLGNSHVFKIIHKEKSELIRREYTVKVLTPGPVFEVISKEDLDFGTVLRGDNSRVATSKITIKNLSGNQLALTPITTEGKVELRNGDSIIKAGNFSVTEELKEGNGEESYFILEGKLVETNTSTLEGEHNGQFYLNIYLK